MNRVIKFRGKSEVGGIGGIKKHDWVYGGITYDDDRVWIDILYFGQILVDKETIGQYTGLHDKNGKEIYEGDLVNIEYVQTTVEKAVIEYKGASFYGSTYADDWELDQFCNVEVIGNIYNNPELLEKG